jgi:hypothetical protein
METIVRWGTAHDHILQRERENERTGERKTEAERVFPFCLCPWPVEAGWRGEKQMGDTQRQRTLGGRQTGDQCTEAVRHPKQLGLVARVPKWRVPCPIGLAHLVWSLGSGHADGNVTVLLMASGVGRQGQVREDGVQAIPPTFPLFQTFFFSLSLLPDLAVNPDQTTWRPAMLQPLPDPKSCLCWPRPFRTWLCISYLG